MDSDNRPIDYDNIRNAKKIIDPFQTARSDFGADDLYSWDIEKIRNHFDRIREILIKEYVILKYYKRQPAFKVFANMLEKELIQYALRFSSGVQKKAAELLGVNPTCLFEKMKKFDIKPENKRRSDHHNDMLREMGLFIIQMSNLSL